MRAQTIRLLEAKSTRLKPSDFSSEQTTIFIQLSGFALPKVRDKANIITLFGAIFTKKSVFVCQCIFLIALLLRLNHTLRRRPN